MHSQKDMIILGIETSCDDTSVAVLKNGKILANIITDQSVHQKYGGIVPELASRAHQKNIVPTLKAALGHSNIELNQLDAIAYTIGPGLMGSLLVGASFAKSLAWSLNVPMIGINHLEAHVLAHFIDDPRQNAPEFPFLALTISGGHTRLIRVDQNYEFIILGETRDDAVGECLDKAGKIMGLPYPAGPIIDQIAKSGDANKFNFPIPDIQELDFSFSGMKTAILYFIRDEKIKNPSFVEDNKADLCASFQAHVMNILLIKLKKAAEKEKIKHVAVAGGVAANSFLRKELTDLGVQNNWTVHMPPLEYCTDNAAMIAMAGFIKFQQADFGSLTDKPSARISA